MENKPLTIGLLVLFALSLINVAIYYLPVLLEFLICIRLIRATVVV
jgi:hypothetical protein